VTKVLKQQLNVKGVVIKPRLKQLVAVDAWSKGSAWKGCAEIRYVCTWIGRMLKCV
jgi:hypothetical protein